MASKKLHIAEQYAEDVLSDKIVACEWVKLACKRYFRDKSQALEKGWRFDAKAAQSVINFHERILKHYQGKWAGKPFLLLPWQQFTRWNIYGWKNADGTRRFQKVGIFVPRKNGKTEDAAGNALYAMGFDGERASEVYSTATDKNQAKIAWEKAKAMVQQSPILLDYLTPMANAIVGEEFMSTFKPWSSDTGKKDGYNPHFAIVDEYHAHKDTSMIDVIESGLGARENPIVYIITTAGFDMNSPCRKFQELCEDVLTQKKEQDDLFTIIYTIDKDDDFENPQIWEKANPSWHGIDTIPAFMQKAYTKAKNAGDFVSFKTKNLNVWTQSAETWIEAKDWEAIGEKYGPDDMEGETCHLGFDLAESYDIASVCAYFPVKSRFLWWFFIPEDNFKKKIQENIDYLKWHEQGWLILTPGNVIDYDYIRRTVSGYYLADGKVMYSDDCILKKYGIQSGGYDPWNSKQLMIRLKEDDGIQLEIYRQGYPTMSFPTKEFKKKVLGREFHHNFNPIVSWMIGNVVLRRDPNDNVMPDKSKSKNKIDGIVAAIIAHAEAMQSENESANENYEIRII